MSDVIETAVEQQAKSWLLSKTIWANAVAAVAVWLGAHHVPVPADQQAEIVTGALAAMNVGLRFITTRPLTLRLPGAGGGTTAPVSKVLGFLSAVALTGTLSGCGQDWQQEVYNAGAVDAIALGEADAYAALPSCVPGGPAICKSEAIVQQLQAENVKVQADLALAQAAVAADQNPSTALATFYAELPELQALLATLPKAGAPT